jgi:hypothetical protein
LARACVRVVVVKQPESNQLLTVLWPTPLQVLSGRAVCEPVLEKS